MSVSARCRKGCISVFLYFCICQVETRLREIRHLPHIGRHWRKNKIANIAMEAKKHALNKEFIAEAVAEAETAAETAVDALEEEDDESPEKEARGDLAESAENEA